MKINPIKQLVEGKVEEEQGKNEKPNEMEENEDNENKPIKKLLIQSTKLEEEEGKGQKETQEEHQILDHNITHMDGIKELAQNQRGQLPLPG